jgi:ATP-binding cassette, subfamily B (MDR/TAP), member 1
MVKQPVSFFDEKANLSGSLTSRLSTELDAIKSLAGPNIGVITVVGTSLLSTVILSLVVGWKLGLVVIFGALPFIFCAGLVHETMEHRFEDIVKETFSESVGFASECIQAIRTVKALNMQGRIEGQFKTLLMDHCAKSQKHAIKSMFWFALFESIDLLCMGLTFW